jgi:hypothetical protein
MATLVGLTGYQFAVETAEASMEVQSFVVTASPQFKTFALDRSGSNKGFAVGPGRLEIQMEGHINAATLGWWDFTFATACTVANDKTYFGVGGTGGVYLDSGTITQNNTDFKTVSMNLSLDAGIA